MIIEIIKKGAKNIVGTKEYPIGKKVYVTDYKYGEGLIKKGLAKRIDENTDEFRAQMFNESKANIEKAKEMSKNKSK